jgi:hypothetical protein
MSKASRQMSEQSAQSTLKGCRKYERALIHGDVPRRIDGNMRKQFDAYREKAERDEVLFGQVRQVLCTHGIDPSRFLPYLNFASHVAKLLRMNLGELLPSGVAVAISVWTAKGRDPAVLRQICSDVFNISGIDQNVRPEV